MEMTRCYNRNSICSASAIMTVKAASRLALDIVHAAPSRYQVSHESQSHLDGYDALNSIQSKSSSCDKYAPGAPLLYSSGDLTLPSLFFSSPAMALYYAGFFLICVVLLLAVSLQLLVLVLVVGAEGLDTALLSVSEIPEMNVSYLGWPSQNGSDDYQDLLDYLHSDDRDEHEVSFEQNTSSLEDNGDYGIDENQMTNREHQLTLHPEQVRQRRREDRTKLIQARENLEHDLLAAIEHTKLMNTTIRSKYSIWRREFNNPHPDSFLRLMKDQVIVAKIYLRIARSKGNREHIDGLTKRIKESEHAIGEANSDAELHLSAFERAKALGLAIVVAKNEVHDCPKIVRRLMAMYESLQKRVSAHKEKRLYLSQYASSVTKPVHCFHLLLTTDYFLNGHTGKDLPHNDKLEDSSLFHYAIFSDNVLATAVVVNSTLVHALHPEKHVFHIVTDRLHFAAMKMWFIAHHVGATVYVQSIDEFKWLNSSYSPIFHQFESPRIKTLNTEQKYLSILSVGTPITYRNPKYLSMLNHLRFYVPEVYPKLDKILFLDDDVVVQKDLTALWDIDAESMVNGAVETCKHRLDAYLDFSHKIISDNFDPHACGWAFGMNIFDLKEWKKRRLTSIYHDWQTSHEQHQKKPWKAGSLPLGLMTFYNVTHHLTPNWHVLGLGYHPGISQSEIEAAAVIHYDGNYKPWLDLAIPKYKPYWSKFLDLEHPYIHRCRITP